MAVKLSKCKNIFVASGVIIGADFIASYHWTVRVYHDFLSGWRCFMNALGGDSSKK